MTHQAKESCSQLQFTLFLVMLCALSDNLCMSDSALVTIHESQFPANIRRDLVHSVRSRRVNHKFHYDSVKQTQKWLRLHQAYSPSRTDEDCAATYDRSFMEVCERIASKRVHLIGLGCGGGQKDARLLKLLSNKGAEVLYTPSDVSVAMVLVARQAVLEVVPAQLCFPLVCDLATAEDLPAVVEKATRPDAERLLTFFGMIPNFEPEVILPRLAALVREKDYLLFSANLAPGPDYDNGIKRVLPLYDNELTRDWLLSFLLDLGVPEESGEIVFTVEESSSREDLKRIAAYFRFRKPVTIRVDDEQFEFAADESIRLFFSHRHTSELVGALLKSHGLAVVQQWITKSGEEGVFLVRKNL
jgi:uncharacterized SAM-dependent methyltransferase